MPMLSVTRHAEMRARQRMSWSRRELVNHWHTHLRGHEFNHGDGIYQIVADGVVFIASWETIMDEVRIITVHVAPWPEPSRWLQPLCS